MQQHERETAIENRFETMMPVMPVMAPSPRWDDITRRQEFMAMKFKELQIVALRAGVQRRKVNLAFDKKELIQLILGEPDHNVP